VTWHGLHYILSWYSSAFKIYITDCLTGKRCLMVVISIFAFHKTKFVWLYQVVKWSGRCCAELSGRACVKQLIVREDRCVCAGNHCAVWLSSIQYSSIDPRAVDVVSDVRCWWTNLGPGLYCNSYVYYFDMKLTYQQLYLYYL
jgi:hypothetical protein